MSDDNIIHVDFASRMGRRIAPLRAQPEDYEAPGGHEPTRDPLGDMYTLRDAAKLFRLSESRLRYWEKSGFIARSGEINGRRYYTFQDLIGIRAAKDLLDEGVALRSVRRSLQALRESLPKVSRPLSSLRIVADGQTLLVRDDRGAYDPTTGQGQLNFEVSSLRDDVVRVLKRSGRESDHRRAYEHYLEGCRLDEQESTWSAAEAAYLRAVELDPSLSNAFTNLGNLMFKRGQLPQAEQFYARALAVDADQPEALYNLGFLLYDRCEIGQAVASFERALTSDPSFADAHFNLAMAYQDLGQSDKARPHWETYLALDPQSQWAEIAKRHLRGKA
ncbi:MAG TPA: tetratricopeptide repeat protein [Polyangiales bacterium]